MLMIIKNIITKNNIDNNNHIDYNNDDVNNNCRIVTYNKNYDKNNITIGLKNNKNNDDDDDNTNYHNNNSNDSINHNNPTSNGIFTPSPSSTDHERRLRQDRGVQLLHRQGSDMVSFHGLCVSEGQPCHQTLQ